MKKVVLPILIVFAGFGLAAFLIATGPSLTPQPAATVAPLIRAVEVKSETIQLSTHTHGTVVPRTESDLIPEVDGRVIEVSPTLVSGGFFRRGEKLLGIEPIDYEVALEDARAGVARANSELTNARKGHARQQDLQNRGLASDSQRDDALNRLRTAEASLRQAKARLTRARRDLERTTILAPYDGRVRNEQVDVGQFVKRGSPIGKIYAVDYAEVRLPIQDEELAFLNQPLTASAAESTPESVDVILRARFAGAEHSWVGEVVRTEGELDPTTRMVHLVARVPEPYVTRDGRPPLAVGLFVDAEIQGAVHQDLIRLPRSALRGESRVLVVDPESRLRFRDVTVLRQTQDDAYISSGLLDGEWVCVSPLQISSDGVQVRVNDEQGKRVEIGASGPQQPGSSGQAAGA